MRIVSEWTQEDLRVTVFHMNGRYSIKLEQGLLEQTYKFRDGTFDSVEALKNAMTDDFYNKSRSIFNSMKENEVSSEVKQDDDQGFDEII